MNMILVVVKKDMNSSALGRDGGDFHLSLTTLLWEHGIKIFKRYLGHLLGTKMHMEVQQHSSVDRFVYDQSGLQIYSRGEVVECKYN